MKISARRALTILTAALLTGCGACNASSALPNIAPLDRARGQDLLYVADGGSGAVLVFSYPQGKRRNGLGGFGGLNGVCADANGNVYVMWWSFTGPGFVSKYPHGGTKEIGRYDSATSASKGCSADATSGDLAVSGAARFLLIYRVGSAKPRPYTWPKGFTSAKCSYDDKGNLFIAGVLAGHYALMERRKGSHEFTDITLPKMNEPYDQPGPIRWDGTYLAFGDGANTIYRLAVSGTKARIAGTVTLESSPRIGSIWIQGDTIVGSGQPQGLSKTTVLIWNYPTGGKPIRTLDYVGKDVGDDVAVSVPPPQ